MMPEPDQEKPKPGDISGVKAFADGLPSFKTWWEWTVVVIVGVSAAVGIFAFVWYSYRSISKFFKVGRYFSYLQVKGD